MVSITLYYKDFVKKYNLFLKNINIIRIIILIYLTINYYFFLIKKKKKKVGIIGLEHSQNIGNNLLKYAIYIKISELGFDPYIIGKKYIHHNISFIANAVKLRLIKKNFKEIKKNDYDILMVNSDQTWRKLSKNSYDLPLLKFAHNWNIPKFVYGASIGVENWKISKKDKRIAKSLLKNFTGISVREKSSIKLIERYLGIKPLFVLDPTLLIDKKYYLNLIKNFKNNVIIDNNFIFIYTVTNSNKLKKFIKKINNKYKIYLIDIYTTNQIQKFIYGIYNCKGVITDSFHGTIFSIIFNKPFISFVYNYRGNARFDSLKEVFNLEKRIFDENSNPDVGLLESPLNLNKTLLSSLKKISINFLKKNLYL